MLSSNEFVGRFRHNPFGCCFGTSEDPLCLYSIIISVGRTVPKKALPSVHSADATSPPPRSTPVIRPRLRRDGWSRSAALGAAPRQRRHVLELRHQRLTAGRLDPGLQHPGPEGRRARGGDAPVSSGSSRLPIGGARGAKRSCEAVRSCSQSCFMCTQPHLTSSGFSHGTEYRT